MQYLITLEVATNVSEGQRTSVSAFTSFANNAICKPDVAFTVDIEYFFFVNRAIFFSNSSTYFPAVDTKPVSIVFFKIDFSSFPRKGR